MKMFRETERERERPEKQEEQHPYEDKEWNG